MSEQQRKKRMDRLAFLGSLAGGLAHEIKNPLSTISVNLQLLKEEWASPKNPKEAKALKRVEILTKEIQRLNDIVNDFLNYARGFSLTLNPTNLNHLVMELIDFLNPEALRLKIRLTTLLDPGLAMIPVDANYVQRALLNIFHNAFQALGEIDENKREIMVRTQKADGGGRITVTDTGPGMTPQVREKIFQVFFSTKKDGTGMGLPTVRRIVEEHDGTISVQSEEGKGTSFELFFPGRDSEVDGGAPPGKT